MLWIEAFHVIAVICWFAGLFYLPRLFVYHAKSDNPAVRNQFKPMEHKLYYYIMTPAAIATLIFGLALWLPRYSFYSHDMWLHIKLMCVLLLYVFHFYCGYLVYCFKWDKNRHTERFYRYLNELPTLMLLIIIVMVIVKPSL